MQSRPEGPDYNTGPFRIFPPFENSNLGHLPKHLGSRVNRWGPRLFHFVTHAMDDGFEERLHRTSETDPSSVSLASRS